MSASCPDGDPLRPPLNRVGAARALGVWIRYFDMIRKRYQRRVEVCEWRGARPVFYEKHIEIAVQVAEGVHDAAWERALSPFPTFAEAAALYLADVNKNRAYVERLVAYFGPLGRKRRLAPTCF